MFLSALLLAFALVLPSPSLSADDSGEASLKFTGADSAEILKFFSSLTGKAFILADEIGAPLTVVLPKSTSKKDAITVLERALAIRGFELIEGAVSFTIRKEQAPLTTESYTANYVPAKKLAAYLTAVFAGPGAVQPLQITSHDDMDRITVRASPIVQKAVAKLLAQLDRRTAQVLIEARIVEVAVTNASRIGVEWEYVTGGAIGHTLSHDAGTLNKNNEWLALRGLRYALIKPDRLRVLVNALIANDKMRLLSAPQMVVIDKEKAVLHVGESVPFLASQEVTDEGAVASTFEYKDIGIDLEVTPRILANRDIALDVKPSVTSIVVFDDVNKIHVVGTRKAETKVIARDGDTLVIGGLMRDSTLIREVGIPWLRKIPLLGLLFRHRSNIPEKNELLILVTARIIATPEEAQRVTREEEDGKISLYDLTGREFRL